MILSALYVYPVKGCRGIPLHSCQLDALGLQGDRRFMFFQPDGDAFLTQRTVPALARIETGLTGSDLSLSYPGAPVLRVPRQVEGAPLRTVRVWKSEGLLAEDCGEESAAWITDILSKPTRLVRVGPAFSRPVKPSYARPGDVVGFADAFPLLVISEASLQDLNDRLAARGEQPVTMDRFRPNLVVRGLPAFGEDAWSRVRVGRVTLRSGGPCSRCIVTTTDQLTGERHGPEPLRTLASYRRDPSSPGDVNFGLNMINEDKSGRIDVGESITVL